MAWSSDGFYRLRLCRSVQSCQPGVGLVEQGTNRNVPLMTVALLLALGGITGFVLQSFSHLYYALFPKVSYISPYVAP